MRYVLLVLALAGVIVSSLALKVHYDTGTEPCSINEHWDCGVVNHSSFAMMGSVPIATIGIAGYLLLAVLALLRQCFVLMLAVFAAFCFALRLTFIEEYALMVWCLYCVISQAIIAIMLLLSISWLASEYFGLKRRTRGAA
jgi:uncharacterized membrane protein